MPKLKIGDQSVTVGDEFLKLAPEQQQSTVDEIASKLPKKSPEESRPWSDVAISAVEHIPSSAWEAGKNIVQPILHPIDTATSIKNIGQGVLEKTGAMSGDEHVKYADAVGEFIKDRYGGMENFKKTLSEDPVGVLMDASMVLTGGGAIAARAPGIAGKVGEVASTVGRATDPLMMAGKGAGKAAEGLRSLKGPASMEDRAADVVARRFTQDVGSGTTAIDAMAKVNGSGKPLTLTDVGGENVKGLAGNVARQPGPARDVASQFLNERDTGAAQRMSQDISKYVSSGPSMHKSVEALLDERSKTGKIDYGKVHSLEGVWSPRLQNFLDDPVLKSGMAKGYEIERLQSLAENRPFNPTQMGVDLDAQGNIQILSKPNMRVLDMGKQGLDAMIAAERNEVTGRLSSRGVAIEKVRRAYVSEMDALDKTGDYSAARSAWSGYSASLDAVRLGRTAFNRSSEEIAAELKKLSPADQEFYRIGVADMMRERLSKTGMSGDEAKAIVKNQWMRDQLKEIIKTPQEFDKFVEAVANENAMFETRSSTIRGSQTAGRLAEDLSQENALTGAAATVGGHLASGSWLGAAKAALKSWRDLGLRANPKLNEEIAKILFATKIDPASPIAQRLSGQPKPQSSAVNSGAKYLPPGGLPIAGQASFQAGRARKVDEALGGGEQSPF